MIVEMLVLAAVLSVFAGVLCAAYENHKVLERIREMLERYE